MKKTGNLDSDEIDIVEELNAMRSIVETLDKMSPPQAHRIMTWVNAFYMRK